MASEGAISVQHDHNSTVTHTHTHADNSHTVARALRHFLPRRLFLDLQPPIDYRSKLYHKRRYLRSRPTAPPSLHPNRRLRNKKHSTLQKMPFKRLPPLPTPHPPVLQSSILVPQELKPFAVSVKKEGKTTIPLP